jgi:hypothetical protein
MIYSGNAKNVRTNMATKTAIRMARVIEGLGEHRSAPSLKLSREAELATRDKPVEEVYEPFVIPGDDILGPVAFVSDAIPTSQHRDFTYSLARNRKLAGISFLHVNGFATGRDFLRGQQVEKTQQAARLLGNLLARSDNMDDKILFGTKFAGVPRQNVHSIRNTATSLQKDVSIATNIDSRRLGLLAVLPHALFERVKA